MSIGQAVNHSNTYHHTRDFLGGTQHTRWEVHNDLENVLLIFVLKLHVLVVGNCLCVDFFTIFNEFDN